MPLVHVSKNPTDRELRHFRIGLAIFAFVAAGAARWRGGSVEVSLAIAAALLSAALASQVVARWRRPIYGAWMRVAVVIGTPISYAVLAVVYFGVILPIGLLLRLFRPSPVTRRFARTAQTYWLRREPRGDPRSYFHQF